MTEQALAVSNTAYAVKELNGGWQVLFKFDNDYGASVVCTTAGIFGGSYGAMSGLWELAVIRWDGEDYELTYDTPITDNVIGWLGPEEVDEILYKIKALPTEIEG